MYKNYHVIGHDLTHHVPDGAVFSKKAQPACFWVRKRLLNAKMTCIFFVFLLSHLVSAAQTITISLSKKEASLKEVLGAIRKQSGYDFLFNKDQLAKAKPVTIKVQNADLKTVLDLCFRDQPFTYALENKVIVVVNKVVFENKTMLIDLKLRVTDQKGNPLPSATVQSKEAGISGYTDSDGRFTLSRAPEDARIVLSYIGYKTDTIIARKRSEMTVMLSQQSNQMDEVSIVSTGYQQISKERATGSFGKPDMKLFQKRVGTQDIMSRLDGLVAGVTVIQGPKGSTGSRGFGGGNTRQSIIRGKSSVSLESDPLYVVNGVPVTDLSVINPDDVADITVLKDASAAAIWGVKATNGVIVITTKKGSSMKPLKISYSGNLTFFGKPDFDYVPVMSSNEYIRTAREIFNPTVFPYATLGTGFIAPHDQLLYDQNRGLITESQANRGLDSLSRINNKDQILDLWYRNAVSTNQTLSASGGALGYNFYASASYTNTRSNRPGEKSNVYRINLNQTFIPVPRLTIGLSTALNNTLGSMNRNISIQNDFLPYQLFKDADGNNLRMNYLQGLSPEVRQDYQTRSRINLDYSPLDEVHQGFTNSNALSINLTGSVNLKLWKGFSFDGTYSYQKSPETNISYNDSQTYNLRKELLEFTVARTAEDIPVYYLPAKGGTYQTVNYDSRNWTVRNQLVYNANLRDDRDHLNLQIGHEALEQLGTNKTTTVRGYNLDLESYERLDYATLNRGVFGAVSSFRSVFNELPFVSKERLNRNESFFGLFNYTMDQKYMLDASIRRDYSNLFGSDKGSQRKPTYSLGGKWIISKETFLSNLIWVNHLGLRATYGITGNSPYIGAGSTRDILQIETNTVTGDAYILAGLANNKLSFEKTRTLNLGIDFTLLNNFISGSIDLYDKKTTDLLGTVKVNPLNGGSNITGNLGNLRNRGIELNLRSVNVQLRDFNWTSNLIFSFNRNKLLAYSAVTADQLTDFGRLAASYVVGYNAFPLFAYQFAGLDELGDPKIRLADGTVTKERDAAKAEDLVYMGTTIPKFNGGLSNTFRYKNLSLTANIAYSLGHVMRRDLNTFYDGRLAKSASSFVGNINPQFLDRWKNPGDELHTNVPSYVPNVGMSYSRRDVNYYNYADINVVSASYVKLREVTLNYTVNPKMLTKLHVEALNLFLQTGNFMLWRANDYGIDPEYQTFSSGVRAMPAFRHSFSFGANLTF